MTITTSQDFETEQWTLLVTSHGCTAPAGPRLFRGPPIPAVQFTHSTEAAARADADTLQLYLDACAAKKKPSKASLRKAGAFV